MIKWFKSFINKLLIKLQEKQLLREIDSEINYYLEPRSTYDAEYVEDSIALKYQEALILLKNRVREMVAAQTTEEYEKLLKKVEDLVKVTYNPEGKEHVETLRKLVTAKRIDVETEQDKVEMIDKRISDYYVLQKYKLERELIKQIKQLRKDNKEEEALELEKEWKEKYGFRNYKTRT